MAPREALRDAGSEEGGDGVATWVERFGCPQGFHGNTRPGAACPVCNRPVDGYVSFSKRDKLADLRRRQECAARGRHTWKPASITLAWNYGVARKLCGHCGIYGEVERAAP